VAARARDESLRPVLAAEEDQAATRHVSERRASKKTVELEKIKLSAKLDHCGLAVTDLVVSLDAEMLAFVGSMNSGARAVQTTLTETLNEPTALKTASDAHLASQKAHHVLALHSGEDDNLEALDTLRPEVVVDSKRTCNGDAKIFKQKLATFKRALTKTSKDKSFGGAQVPSELDSPPPLHIILIQLIAMPDKDFSKFSACLLEAKGGVRGCAIAVNPLKDPLVLIKGNAFAKNAFIDIRTHLKENDWGVINMLETPKRNEIVSFLKAAYDATMFNRLLVPSNEDLPTVLYEPRFFVMAKSFTDVGLCPFAATQARLMLAGSQIVDGIGYDKCPDETMKEK
jgi:hypothetical protein